MSGVIPDIRTVHGNTAVLHIVETHQQIDQRRLAAAGGSDDRHTLARFHGHGQILDQMLLLRIGKIHVGDFHGSFGILKHRCIFRFRHLRFGFDQFKHTAGAGQRILQFRYHTGDLIKRLGKLIGVA